MDRPAAQTAFCPYCKAENQPGAERCWICQQPLEPAGLEHAGAPAAVGPTLKRTFHLNSLMVLIALVAVLLGLFRQSAGLGILMTVITLPALLRLRSVAAERRARDQPMTLSEKIFDFIGSAVVAWMMLVILGISAGVAFFLMCVISAQNFDAGLGSLPYIIPVGLPLVVGGACAILLGRYLWRRRR
jgi:hypothetical protein